MLWPQAAHVSHTAHFSDSLAGRHGKRALRQQQHFLSTNAPYSRPLRDCPIMNTSDSPGHMSNALRNSESSIGWPATKITKITRFAIAVLILTYATRCSVRARIAKSSNCPCTVAWLPYNRDTGQVRSLPHLAKSIACILRTVPLPVQQVRKSC
jgi:hypothetical protein